MMLTLPFQGMLLAEVVGFFGKAGMFVQLLYLPILLFSSCSHPYERYRPLYFHLVEQNHEMKYISNFCQNFERRK